MHQVTEFVEESLHVAIIHEAGISRSGRWEVADEDRFRKLLAANAVEDRGHFCMAELARAGMHVEIETSDRLSAVDDEPGFNGRIPGGDILFLLKADVEQIGRGVENALLHFREREVRAGPIENRNRTWCGGPTRQDRPRS